MFDLAAEIQDQSIPGRGSSIAIYSLKTMNGEREYFASISQDGKTAYERSLISIEDAWKKALANMMTSEERRKLRMLAYERARMLASESAPKIKIDKISIEDL